MKKEILEILEEDGRTTPETLAAMIGTDPEEVRREIAALEEEKIILSYGALINWEKIGEDVVLAMIDVKVVPQREVGFDQVAERIYRFPEVQAVFLISGGYDLSVLVQGKSLKEVALFVAERLATLENVQSTMTHFILKKYKEAGIIFEDSEADRRQVVTP